MGKESTASLKWGIDFRRDGVYQLLISINGDEDQGFSAINYSSPSRTSIELVQGTGFGSSHGTSHHSAPTIKVFDDDIYELTVLLEPSDEKLMIRGTSGGKPN